MSYYKLIVTLCNGEVLQYKNLTIEAVGEVKKTIWTQGVKKNINHVTVELINPLTISKVLIVESDFEP